MDIYRKLGVNPVINACGTVTRLGGARMPRAVLDAFCQASESSVPLDQMQAAASRRIAAATGADAGLVTCGAAAGLTLGAAAMLTGHDVARMDALPRCLGFASQMVVAREHRNGYDHAVRAAGVELVEVGYHEVASGAGVRRVEAWEYEAAITSETAGILYTWTTRSCPPLSEVVEVARRHQLPVLVDAAAEIPPATSLRELIAMDADLVAFSGGKGLRGPQSTGILCGRGDLISAAALQMLDMDDDPQLWDPPQGFIDRTRLAGIPRQGIGRGLKVSPEEIAAVLAALDLFLDGGGAEHAAGCRDRVQRLHDKLTDAGFSCALTGSEASDRWPTLEVAVADLPMVSSAVEVCRDLRNGDPAIYVGTARVSEGLVCLDPACLEDDAVEIVARRMREVCGMG